MCDGGIQKHVLHIDPAPFPLHDCHSVGIFIWECMVLQKGKRSRDLIACCHGNSHAQLHSPEMRNCPATWSEPPPWSCKLLEALSHRNKPFIVFWLLYSHSQAPPFSWPVPAEVPALGRAGYTQPGKQGWMAPPHSSATPAPAMTADTCCFPAEQEQYCIWSGGMGPTQVLSDYTQHSGSAVSKDKTEFVWLHYPKDQTRSPSWSSSSATSEHNSSISPFWSSSKFWSDLASQNLMNVKVKTCFGTQTSLSSKWKDSQDFSKKL